MIQAARFPKSIADFIQADVNAMKGIAVGMASPGFNAFGKTLIITGSTAAKVLSGSLAVLGIFTGIWDIAVIMQRLTAIKVKFESFR